MELETMKRSMGWRMTASGRAVTCSACSWWIPVFLDVDTAKVAFDEHDCAEHPMVESGKRSSTLLRLL